MIPLRDENPTLRTPFVTIALIVACVLTFVLVQPSATRSLGQEIEEEEVIEELEFTYERAAIPCELIQGRPLSLEEIQETVGAGDTTACRDDAGSAPALFPEKSVWLAVLISMFLHGGWLHLAGNMVFLWIFGNNVEDHAGALRYLGFYLAAGAVATAAHVFTQLDSTIPLVGASGAIAGVMGAYLVWFPWARVRTVIMIGLVPLWPRLPAALLLIGWFLLQFLTDPASEVAWAAHVGGFAFGVIVAFLARQDDGLRDRLHFHRRKVTGSTIQE